MKASGASLFLSLACSLLPASLWAGEQNATILFDAQQVAAEKVSSKESLDAYLSELKRKQFGYDYEKVKHDSAMLRDSWIMPIRLQYSLTRENPNHEYGSKQTEFQSAAIVLDQPIFRSGGIYYGIKFAQASRDYSNYSIGQQRRIMIKTAVELLMQIKQSELGIEKQMLQIANSQINLEQKQEQYLNGQLDSGFLNNAIIEKNIVTQTLYDLETAKQRLVTQFGNISDMDYREAKIPFLAMLDEEKFLKYNIDLKLISSRIERDRYNKNVTLAKYLPVVSIQGSYNWQRGERSFGQQIAQILDTKYYRYGFSASMPLDVNSYNDYESARIDYMKSLVVIDDKKRELKALYEQVMQNLENYNKKIALAEENRQLYATLLDETEGLYRAGYKTEYDVDTLKNSEKIQRINKRIYEIDKQLELLNLYEKLTGEI
jgi:hypothetical protein